MKSFNRKVICFFCCFFVVFSCSEKVYSQTFFSLPDFIVKNKTKSTKTTSLTVTNKNAADTNNGTVETLIRFTGDVNKGDSVTLTYTAEKPYNQRIFDVFVNNLSFNDLGNLFDRDVSVKGNELTVVLTAKQDNLVSPQISIIFQREVLHGDMNDENCEFTINNTSTFNGTTKENEPILINSTYFDFSSYGIIEAGIAGANYWYADKVSTGFEDLPGKLTSNTLAGGQPFIYIRNSKEGLFIPNATIHYDQINSITSADRVEFIFTPGGPGKMNWDMVNLYTINNTTGETNILNKVDLTKKDNSYIYESKTSNIDGITQSELFTFGIKVDDLSFDTEPITDLRFTTNVYDENNFLIASKTHINGISFVSASGAGWYPTLTIREDFSILIGEKPDYKKDLQAIDPQIEGPDLDITDRVIIDDSAVDYDKAGVYPVIYTVTDDDDNTVTKTLQLTIMDTSVTINYVDEKDNLISSVVLPSKHPGESFSQKSPEFIEYTLVDDTQSTVEGIFTNTPQTITVKYKKDLSKGIQMKVKYINKQLNTSIYDDIDTKHKKSEDEFIVFADKSIKDNIDNLVLQNNLTLNYEGYETITSDNYVIEQNGTEIKPTETPQEDFTLIFYYTGTLYIKDAPDISFGEVTRTLFGKSTVKPIKQSTTGNLVLVNTTGQEDWKLTASLPKGIYNKDDDTIKLQSNLIFKNPASSTEISLNNMPDEVATNKNLTLDPLGTIDLDSSFKLDVYSKNDVGDYTGSVLWSINRVP